MTDHGWIGVDLDGTLAHYDHWRGVEHVGDPIIPMLDRVRKWLAQGREVRIFTARVASPFPEEREKAARAIHEWCLKHLGAILEVTNAKDFKMVELWDDRAVQVVPNTGMPVSMTPAQWAAHTKALLGGVAASTKE